VIVVCGEALIDLISHDGVLKAIPGGGPFNTAVSLGRLGVPVGFLSPLSTDHYGRLLERTLDESGVDLSYVLHSDAPTPLALAHVGRDGDPEYTFYLTGTAYAELPPSSIPELDARVVALHLGTLALATDPPRSAYEDLIEREAGRRVIALDPNVRPTICGDLDLYRVRFERWLGFAHVVKLSAADASWLYDGLPPAAVCERLVELGARLVVLTLGADGAIAQTASSSTSARPPRVKVVDTVGAGDAFGAGLLQRLWRKDRLDRDGVGRLDDAELADIVSFAAAVAALQSTRAGSSPPTLAEVEALIAAERD
jgi:fructokinase